MNTQLYDTPATTIEEAARRMRLNFEAMDPERRSCIIAHFVDHCKSAAISLSPSFVEAFDIACAPWKDLK